MASDTMAVGSPEGGPVYWAFPPIGAGLGCGTTYRLVCMGTKKNAAIPAPSVNGMLIWVSEPFFYLETGAPGATTPDQECQADRPAGVTTARALDPYINWQASGVVRPAIRYFRPDGTFVGLGQEIISAGPLESGIWQLGNGSDYPPYFSVLTGNNGTCSMGTMLLADGSSWWNGYAASSPCPAAANQSMTQVYCVQTQ